MRSLAIAAAAMCCAIVWPGRPSVAADSAFDEMWERYQSQKNTIWNADGSFKPMPAAVRTPLEKYLWVQYGIEQRRVLGLEAYLNLKQDPRRWQALADAMANSVGNPVIKNYGDFDKTGTDGLIVDVPATEARYALEANLLRTMIDAPDADEKSRLNGLRNYVDMELMLGTCDTNRELTALRERIDFGAPRLPAADRETMVATWEEQYIGQLEQRGRNAEAQALLAKHAQGTNAKLAPWAQARLKVASLRTAPVDLKFTAADGREVDFQKLRGKVVLLEFWATWCDPCVKEMPAVKAVYEKYHAKGFEIVGISLDHANSQEKLLRFVKKNAMPWPQHYDGKGWQNRYALEYGITGVPSMLLFGKDGRLVEEIFYPQGEKIQPLVRKHLGLPAAAG